MSPLKWRLMRLKLSPAVVDRITRSSLRPNMAGLNGQETSPKRPPTPGGTPTPGGLFTNRAPLIQSGKVFAWFTPQPHFPFFPLAVTYVTQTRRVCSSQLV